MNDVDSKREFLFKEECYAIQGAIFDVYREMGGGFLESVYQECLEREFHLRRIPFESQKEIRLSYKGSFLDQTFKPDIICYENIIVELKAVKLITPDHKAQILNYMKVMKFKLDLLVNFGDYPKATLNRFIL